MARYRTTGRASVTGKAGKRTRGTDMTNNIEILLMVIAVNGCVLGLASLALWRLNRAVDAFDR
jgi:hypothetical protein